MNIDQQLSALHSALDDMLDLERGLADAMLPRAHAQLMAGLDHALDLDAGLAQVVSPVPALPPRVLDGFIAYARELSELPAAERLAVRAWLPGTLVVEAYVLAKHVPTVRALADKLDDIDSGIDVRAYARIDARRVVQDLDRANIRSTEVRNIARLLMDTRRRSSRAVRLVARRASRQLHERVATRLAALLMEIDGRAHGSVLTQHIHSGHIHVAFADALLRPLSQLVSALTSVVGADLTSADLTGFPLNGVRWSSHTRWPEDWKEWVRENSVPVAADIFEIRSGKAESWLPT